MSPRDEREGVPEYSGYRTFRSRTLDMPGADLRLGQDGIGMRRFNEKVGLHRRQTRVPDT